MRSFAPLRLTSQLCFFAAFFCFFPILRVYWPIFALTAFLAFVAALIAVRVGKMALRLALGLLPALALVLVTDKLGLIAVCLATAYTAAILGIGRFTMKIWRYQREAKLLIFLCFVVELLSVLLITLHHFSVQGVCFAGASVLMTLLALRALWLGQSVSLGWEAGTTGLFFLPMLGGAAIGAGLWAVFPLLEKPVMVLAALIGGLMNIFTDFFNWLTRDAYKYWGGDARETETAVKLTQDTRELIKPEETLVPPHGFRKPEVHISWELIVFIAVALALLAFVIWLSRRSEKAVAGHTPDRFREEKEHGGPRRRTRRGRRRETDTNRSQVRAAYREYLLFLQQHGIRPKRSATTLDVSESSRDLLIEPDETLRALYRKARYSTEEITPEDLHLAQSCLDKLIAKENLQSEQK